MEISRLTALDNHQVMKVLQLVNECKQHDPINIMPTLTNEGNFDPNIPCLYLLEEGGYLMSFLSVYMPTPYYGEIVGFTYPAARRKHMFKQLWNAALEEIGKSGKCPEMQVMIVSDGKSVDTAMTMNAMHMKLKYTEYLLSKPVIPSGRPIRLTAEMLDPTDEKVYYTIYMMHETIFQEGELSSRTFVESTRQEFVQNYIVRNNENTPVGMFHLALDGDRTFLFGFGVLPQYRGKGYGKQMVDLVQTLCPETSKEVGLQVASYNPEAYNLYKKCGFAEKSKLEYYNNL